MPDKGFQVSGVRTVRIYCKEHLSNPMDDVRAKGLGDVVLAAVPLENYRERPDSAIFVDLAVLEDGIGRVHQVYDPVDFAPLGYDDPIILAQHWAHPDSSVKSPGYMEIYSRYITELAKRRDAKGPRDSMTQEWFQGSFERISELLRRESELRAGAVMWGLRRAIRGDNEVDNTLPIRRHRNEV